jgi:ACS family hexuronate transporter-like MFS transporter
MERVSANAPIRSNRWKWWVCGLLLFASAINYMDRQTLSNAATRITKDFTLTQAQYGNLETWFGWAFAAGSLFFGIAADRFSVRIIYPIVLLLWSSVGFVTGLSHDYSELLWCRTLLGFFEGGHWPCAVKTTRLLLEAKDRSMGNSVLQAGTSIGSIITPLVMRALLTEELGSWRRPFMIVGATGLLWVIFWLALVRERDLATASPETEPGSTSDLWRALFSKRMVVIFVVIALINTGWQVIRAWLPKYLQEGRGYSEGATLNFTSAFYGATDIGVIAAGALTLWLVNKRGFTVTRSRIAAFGACSLVSAVAIFLPLLQRGPLLLIALLLIGAGALGVFPIYHAFTQDLSREHQGKVTGVASIAAWGFSQAQTTFGRYIDRTHSFDLGLVIAGLMPLAAFLVLLMFWRDPQQKKA